jgi:hypothetical protein
MLGPIIQVCDNMTTCIIDIDTDIDIDRKFMLFDEECKWRRYKRSSLLIKFNLIS